MNWGMRLDRDHKKSGLREVFTGTDYKSAPAGEITVLEASSKIFDTVKNP